METSSENLLRNPSFEEGETEPTHWKWVVLKGQPVWEFGESRDEWERRMVEADISGFELSARSIRILQDGQSWHGEFQQTVPCKGRQRYRLSGLIRCTIEGSGSQSGANLYLRSFAKDNEIHDAFFRPFFVGMHEIWRWWSLEYVTPAEADQLLVSFDMRDSGGVAWFKELDLREVLEPFATSTALCAEACKRDAFRPMERWSFREFSESYVLEHFVLGSLAASGTPSATGQQEALFVSESSRAENWTWEKMLKVSDTRRVIVTPSAIADAVDEIKCRAYSSSLREPCARIVTAHAVTHGFVPGDILPWAKRNEGECVQGILEAGDGVWTHLGLTVLAVSENDYAGATGRPMILHRPGGRGGDLIVMNLDPFNSCPKVQEDAIAAVTILCNALGRPQTGRGRYVYPGFPMYDYAAFVRELEGIAAAHPSLRLVEEGRTRLGLPIYSLSIGREDAPVFYADAGIHSDEWAPCYGQALYMAQLAELHEKGHPVAAALLRRMQVKCIPLLSPDGWANHVRFIRNLDLNRNFGPFWDLCKDRKGPAPLSEPETQIVDRIFRTHRVLAAANWHETTACTNWVGVPHTGGRYAKYMASVPAIFRQLIDGRHFAYQAATWTQITDERNFHWHTMDSFPYLRDYSPQKVSYELFHADSMGIDGITIEQYGNSELTAGRSPYRTDMTISILEMLLGLQIGLVCHNPGWETKEVSIPLAITGQRDLPEAVVYDAAGNCLSRQKVEPHGETATARATVPAGCWMVVEAERP